MAVVSDELGKRLVRALINAGDLTKLVSSGIDPKDIFGDAASTMTWVIKFFEDNKIWPTCKQVEENTGVTLTDPPDDLPYVCDLIRKRTLGKKLEVDLKSAIAQLSARDPDEALKVITEAAIKHKAASAAPQIRTIRTGGPTRYSEYQELQSIGGGRGVRTPWRNLNRSINMWANGQLHVIVARQNTGKAQPVGAKILGMNGWREIGKAKVGDLVATVTGEFTTVTGVFPQGSKKVVDVVFSDGTVTRCCEDHLWEVRSTSQKHGKILTAAQIRESNRLERPYRIPMSKPVQHPERRLEIDPYLMGMYLGDGGSRGHSCSFTNEDAELVESFNRLLAPLWCELSKRPRGEIEFDVVGTVRHQNRFKTILREFKLCDVLSTKKWIPKDYLYASVEQRIAVLQGILDTDGSVDRSGGIDLGLSSEKLLDDVRELVTSLGGTASKAYRKDTNSWRSWIVLPKSIQPFRLKKKLDAYLEADKKRLPYRAVVEVRDAGQEECVCIAVKHPSHLYLTEQHVVTHNSWACCILADDALRKGFKVLVITMEMSTQRIERRIDSLRYKIPFGDIRDAQIDLLREIRWKQNLIDDQTGRGDILIADKRLIRYVSDVTALVLEHKPDLVVIDGGYRFASRGSNGDWESAKQIVAELQTTAESTDVPWVVTTQQGDVAAKSRMESQDRALKVKYAKEWVINPDVVIEMYADEDMRMIRQMEWKILKERDSKGESRSSDFRTHWDLDEMNFEELVSGEDEDTSTSSGVTY
jgi:replicative DNA helicase